MDYAQIRYVPGRVAALSFHRPQALNALTREMIAEARDALGRAAADDAVRVIVLGGEGRAFCAGADLKANVSVDPFDAYQRIAGEYVPFVLALRTCAKPVLAAVRGAAVGAGMSLALACDLLVAARSARFGQTFVKVGLCPDLGSSIFLPRAVGAARAREMALFGDLVSAEEGLALGFVNRVFPDESFDAEVAAYAARLAQGAPMAMAIAKRLFERSFESDLAALAGEEALAQSLLRTTADHREGVAAFQEKRAPQFGRG
jgi:2-(1,2-epoxy-1,2-dihydrophenyl)acetyl-CoA isomerase